MNTERKNRLTRSAAVHEAGHIFMAGFFGVKIGWACWNEVRYEEYQHLTGLQIAMINCAGSETQRFLGEPTWSGSDFYDKGFIKDISNLPRVARKLIWRNAQQKVREVFALDPHAARHIIREIANRILEKGIIHQADLDNMQKENHV